MLGVRLPSGNEDRRLRNRIKVAQSIRFNAYRNRAFTVRVTAG